MSRRKRHKPSKMRSWLAMHINSRRFQEELEPKGLLPGGSPGTMSFPSTGV